MDGDDQGVDAVHDDIDDLWAHAQSRDGAAGAGKKLVLFSRHLADMQRVASEAGERVNAHELLLTVLADADGIVATQGGPTYLSLIWGPHKRVVTMEIKGLESMINAVQWYPQLSNTSRVESARNPQALLTAVRAMFLAGKGKR